jgi:hypothetical protein
MGELGLTVTLEGVLVSLLGEAKRIEETEGGEGTWDVINRVLRKRIIQYTLAIYFQTIT